MGTVRFPIVWMDAFVRRFCARVRIRPSAARSLHGAAMFAKEASMQKPKLSSAEEARQQTMTSYLSLVVLVLTGFLVLALAERYL
jgi:hypothetical protein